MMKIYKWKWNEKKKREKEKRGFGQENFYYPSLLYNSRFRNIFFRLLHLSKYNFLSTSTYQFLIINKFQTPPLPFLIPWY